MRLELRAKGGRESVRRREGGRDEEGEESDCGGGGGYFMQRQIEALVATCGGGEGARWRRKREEGDHRERGLKPEGRSLLLLKRFPPHLLPQSLGLCLSFPLLF